MKKRKKEFSSKYKLDQDMYNEFFKAYLNDFMLKISLIILLVALLLNLILKEYTFVIMFALLEILFIILFKIIIKKNRTIMYKRILESRGLEEINNSVIINEDEITLVDLNNRNKTVYNYDQIIGVIESKNLIILKLKYNLGIILNKETLKGTKEDLIEFLKEKCQYTHFKVINRIKPKNYFYIINICLCIIILIISIVFYIINENYLKILRNNIEKKDFQLVLLDKIDKELELYNINKKDFKCEAYLYKYEDYNDAKDMYNYLLEQEDGKSKCTEKIGYKFCEINNKNNYTVLIQKEKYLFWGYGDNKNKDNLKKLIHDINYLKN